MSISLNWKRDESQESDLKDAVYVCLPLITTAISDIQKGDFPKCCLLNVYVPTSPLKNKRDPVNPAGSGSAVCLNQLIHRDQDQHRDGQNEDQHGGAGRPSLVLPSPPVPPPQPIRHQDLHHSNWSRHSMHHSELVICEIADVEKVLQNEGAVIESENKLKYKEETTDAAMAAKDAAKKSLSTFLWKRPLREWEKVEVTKLWDSISSEKLDNTPDQLLWIHSGKPFTVKDGYNVLEGTLIVSRWDFYFIWKLRVPPKVQIFL
ncbi:hypothetical protein POM88_045280 [Heracleum sosnowskyi]|uniref:Uncharacterized protein n=1 Tax=Heracleum sosnowskyi TaxID=360622 RepID=A0AAD8H6P6_9APIA|nr:hypothetical protein POM88_045280 [Heracleum sosnowskyi]